MLAAYAKNYRRLWQGHWWWQARRRFVLGRLDVLLAGRPPVKMLDIGCGDGLFFDELTRFGEPWGVEPDAGLVDPNGKWAPRIALVPFDGRYDDGREYGLVLMLDALEHIEDDRAAARRAAALLAPGGLFFATVPALPALWSAHDEANRHHRRYTRAALREVLEDAGLEIESLGYYFGWPVLPMFARKLWGSGAAAAADYKVVPPPGPVNALLYALSVLEQTLTPRGGTPVGSSLFAVARRPAAA